MAVTLRGVKLGIAGAALLGATLLCVRVTPAGAAATTRTWTGKGDGKHWSDPANWSGDAVPINGDSVTAAGVATVNDLTDLHLATLTYTASEASHGRAGGLLSGNRLVVDTVADAWASRFELPLAVGADGNWGLGLYESFKSIDLNGHHLHIVLGPGHELPVRFEGELTFESIASTGGGALSLDPNVQLTLYSPTSQTFAGTISGGALNVDTHWSATSFDGDSVALFQGGQLNHVHIRAPTAGHATGVSVLLYYAQGLPHSRAEVQSLTMASGSTFYVDTGFPPLVVDGYTNLDGPSLFLETDPPPGPRGAAKCPGTYPVIENRSASAVVGTFSSVKGGDNGIPPFDAFKGETLTAHYDAGDGNDVNVTCALATPVSVEESTTTAATTTAATTTTSGPQLPATGSSGTPTLLLVAAGMVTLGTVAVRVRRRSSWRVGV